jgi:protein required for attachment to host cells
MSKTWILTANASTARIYENGGPKQGLKLVKELNHPQSREKGSELVTDRPGHHRSAGNGHGAFVQQTDPKQNEAAHFALELARELESGRTSNSFQRLMLVASPPFIGMLNDNLSIHVKNLVSESIQKDYTKVDPRELSGHLEKYIYL